MPIGGKTAATVVVAALVLGLWLAKRHEIVAPGRTPATSAAAPAALPRHTVSSWLKVRQLRILGADGSPRVWLGESGEGSPGIWMTNAQKTATVELGVHGNGFPYVLVSDGAIRNFGLDMTEPHRSPFLVWYAAEGAKHDVFGHYCDRPDRVCVR